MTRVGPDVVLVSRLYFPPPMFKGWKSPSNDLEKKTRCTKHPTSRKLDRGGGEWRISEKRTARGPSKKRRTKQPEKIRVFPVNKEKKKGKETPL